MVKLSAATVAIDESESYEVSEGVKAYVEPTEDDGEATSDAGDDGGNWQAEALARIKEARERVAQREAVYLRCKEETKDAKTVWEAAVEELTSVIDASTETLPLFDRQPAAEATEATSGDDGGSKEAWRTTSIDVLFSGIERFGAKKQDTVRDAIPTLGAFEDLRQKASLAGDPLKEHMPKGIGQDTCDQLEEAALNWIAARMREEAGGGDAEAS